MDRQRLLALLRLTASEHDGEALAAARAANALLARSGVEWGDVVLSASTDDPPPRKLCDRPVVVRGQRLVPFVGPTWSATADFLVRHITPREGFATADGIEKMLIGVLAIALRRGASPSVDDVRLMRTLYERAGGVVR